MADLSTELARVATCSTEHYYQSKHLHFGIIGFLFIGESSAAAAGHAVQEAVHSLLAGAPERTLTTLRLSPTGWQGGLCHAVVSIHRRSGTSPRGIAMPAPHG
jgi:hypothetical protein